MILSYFDQVITVHLPLYYSPPLNIAQMSYSDFLFVQSNIDLTSNKISIEQSLTRKGQAVYSLTAPKNTSSIRIISIPSKIARELAKIKPNCHLDNFVFLKSGRPLAERSLDRAFNAAANECWILIRIC